MIRRLSGLLVVLTLLVGAGIPPAMAAPAFATAAFQRTWTRTDDPVASGGAQRTWMWGPQPNTVALTEAYAQAPGGLWVLQYFDKTRMEANWFRASYPWDVTNGLLAEELVTGKMQFGDTTCLQFAPAAVNVAGDANDPNGPTYVIYAGVMRSGPYSDGALIDETIDRAGNVGSSTAFDGFGVTAKDVGAPTHHTVASVFWAFMNNTGTVNDNGKLSTEALFPNPFYATGYPLTEAYWATVLVGGTPKQVLTQVFERRVLTYTPNNPTGWQVEAGNVGQQYYA